MSSRTWTSQKPPKKQEEDLVWKTRIEEIQGIFPKYGYLRVGAELKRQGYKVNKKKIHRIMSKYGLIQKKKQKKHSTTDSNHSLSTYPNLIKDLIPAYPDHIWVGDITYIRLGKGFVYLAVILDVFTRGVRGWALGETLEAGLTISALNNALSRYNVPEYHHSDQGKQYCSYDYTDILKKNGIRISMSRKATPTDNPYIESFFKTLKYDEVYMWEYDTIETVRLRISEFIDTTYSKKRLHSSLGYVPPEEFESEWNKNKGRKQIIPIQKTENVHENHIFAVS
jgi:putative transposase